MSPLAWMKNGMPVLMDNGRAMLSDNCCCGGEGYVTYQCEYSCATDTFSALESTIEYSDAFAAANPGFVGWALVVNTPIVNPDSCPGMNGEPLKGMMLLDGSSPDIIPQDVWYKIEAGGSHQRLYYNQTLSSELGEFYAGGAGFKFFENHAKPELPTKPQCPGGYYYGYRYNCETGAWSRNATSGGSWYWTEPNGSETSPWWPTALRICPNVNVPGDYVVLAPSWPGYPQFAPACMFSWSAYYDCASSSWVIIAGGATTDTTSIAVTEWTTDGYGGYSCVTDSSVQPAPPNVTPICGYSWWAYYNCATPGWEISGGERSVVGSLVDAWVVDGQSAYCIVAAAGQPSAPTATPVCE